jgi:hypothetical protein
VDKATFSTTIFFTLHGLRSRRECATWRTPPGEAVVGGEGVGECVGIFAEDGGQHFSRNFAEAFVVTGLAAWVVDDGIHDVGFHENDGAVLETVGLQELRGNSGILMISETPMDDSGKSLPLALKDLSEFFGRLVADSPHQAHRRDRLDLLEVERTRFQKRFGDAQLPSVAPQGGGVGNDGYQRKFVIGRQAGEQQAWTYFPCHPEIHQPDLASIHCVDLSASIDSMRANPRLADCSHTAISSSSATLVSISIRRRESSRRCRRVSEGISASISVKIMHLRCFVVLLRQGNSAGAFSFVGKPQGFETGNGVEMRIAVDKDQSGGGSGACDQGIGKGQSAGCRGAECDGGEDGNFVHRQHPCEYSGVVMESRLHLRSFSDDFTQAGIEFYPSRGGQRDGIRPQREKGIHLLDSIFIQKMGEQGGGIEKVRHQRASSVSLSARSSAIGSWPGLSRCFPAPLNRLATEDGVGRMMQRSSVGSSETIQSMRVPGWIPVSRAISLGMVIWFFPVTVVIMGNRIALDEKISRNLVES